MENLMLTFPSLTLRSQPVYSADDHQRRGRTPAEWEAMGKEIDAVFSQALKDGQKAYVLKIAGARHMSFSDVPIVLSDMISRFGGKIIAPEKGQEIIMATILYFLQATFSARQQDLESTVAAYPEVSMEVYMK